MTISLATAPYELQNLKIYLIDLTGLGKDALHVYAGMTVFLLTRLLWRWRGGWMVAWIAALALATGIEWLDMRAEGKVGSIQPDAEHWHDIWNTMVWPTVLLFLGRWLQPRPKPAVDPSGDLADKSLDDAAEQPPTV